MSNVLDDLAQLSEKADGLLAGNGREIIKKLFKGMAAGAMISVHVAILAREASGILTADQSVKSRSKVIRYSFAIDGWPWAIETSMPFW